MFWATCSIAYPNKTAGIVISRSKRSRALCARPSPVSRFIELISSPVSQSARKIGRSSSAQLPQPNAVTRRCEESIFNFLRDVLLFRFPPNLDTAGRAAHTHFVLKFQQTTGPVMAKGLEDTVFYIYNRLAALNEVGGDPQQFGLSVDAFHRAES